MKAKLFLLPLLVMFFLGCVSPEMKKVRQLPEVQQFLAENPDARINVTLIKRSLFTQQEVETFRSRCGKDIEGNNFYFAEITGGSNSMEVWLDESLGVLCTIKPHPIGDIGITQQCNSNAECDDANNETFDECVAGKCEYRLKTCKERGGKICQKEWYCSIDFIEVYDTDRCCLGECTETKCAFVECESNEKCINGECILMTCKELQGIECPQMLKCDAATIIASDTNKCCTAECEQINPCSEVRCPEGTRCREGTCVYE